MEDKKKKRPIDHILEYCNAFPDFAVSFLMETGTELANTTRYAYAMELDHFFDYMITYLPDCAESEKKVLTLEQIKSVTSQDISRYLMLYKGKDNKERTLARKRAALSSFFTYLTDNRKIPFNPVTAAAKVKIHQSDEVLYLDMDEQMQLLHTIDTADGMTKRQRTQHSRYRLRDMALISLLLDTGLRISELYHIDIKDLDFERCYVVVTRKGGNIQSIYFSDSVRDLILKYIEERKMHCKTVNGIAESSPLFVTTNETRLSVRAIQKMVKQYATVSLPGKGSKISPHKMRSSFAMEFYDSEKDILALQRKLGHKNITATNIYAKATDKKMQETRSILEEKRKKYEKQTN